MFSALRKFLVIFLAILQLIAPLVHAHAGEKVLGVGLHVPGLEVYGVGQDAFMSGAINHDFDFDGIIVGVDAGMKDRQINAIVDLDDSQYLHQQTALFKTEISPFDVNFSPHPTQSACRLFIPSLSPRAPPVQ